VRLADRAVERQRPGDGGPRLRPVDVAGRARVGDREHIGVGEGGPREGESGVAGDRLLKKAHGLRHAVAVR